MHSERDQLVVEEDGEISQPLGMGDGLWAMEGGGHGQWEAVGRSGCSMRLAWQGTALYLIQVGGLANFAVGTAAEQVAGGRSPVVPGRIMAARVASRVQGAGSESVVIAGTHGSRVIGRPC